MVFDGKDKRSQKEGRQSRGDTSFAPDRACGGRCLVLEMEISAHVVRCPGHAAAGHGLVTGPGWFRHYQHRLGRTGVGVGEPVFRLLRRDDPSHNANRSMKVQVSRTPEEGSCQSIAPVTVEPGTRALRPAGLSSAERISDSPRVWELRGLDATTPVAPW